MMFVVTPLNLLGKQNIQELERTGLSAIAVTGKNANAGTFKVHQENMKMLNFCFILLNPLNSKLRKISRKKKREDRKSVV